VIIFKIVIITKVLKLLWKNLVMENSKKTSLKHTSSD
jgi:hypothetical protein